MPVTFRVDGGRKGLDLMPTLEVIQFHFPNRRREVHKVDRPEAICNMMQVLKQKGFQLEFEDNNGTLWYSVVNHTDDDGPLAVDDIFPATKSANERIDRLIEKAYDRYVLRKRVPENIEDLED